MINFLTGDDQISGFGNSLIFNFKIINLETANTYFNTFTNMVVQYAPKVLLALFTYYAGNWAINSATNILGTTLEKRGVDSTIRPFLVSLVNIGLKALLLLSVASMIGIEITSFIAILTALVFAVGTALSGSLGHFSSGVMLLIFRPYKVGDLIKIGENTGHVESIEVFNTVLITADNRKIIIPNGIITSGVITNISGCGQVRIDMTVTVHADNDISHIRKLITDVALECPQVLKTIPVEVVVNKLGAGDMEIAVRPWCKSDDYYIVFHYMQENVKNAFDKEHIALASPVMEVKMKS